MTATLEEFSGNLPLLGCAHTIRSTDVTGKSFLYDVMDGLTQDEALDCMAEADYIAVLHSDPICTGE